MTLATLDLLGVKPDGTDLTIDRLLVVAFEGDRMILEKPDFVSRETDRRATVTRRRSYDLRPVPRGTRARVAIGDLAYTAVVERGYGRRLSLSSVEASA